MSLRVVARREYFETVRKKSFLIWTVLTPVLFMGLIFVPSALLSRGMEEKKVLVLDGTGSLAAAIEEGLAEPDRSDSGRDRRRGSLQAEVVPAPDQEAAKAAAFERLRRKDVDGVLLVPAGVLDGDVPATYYSRSATDIFDSERIAAALNRAVIRVRAAARGIADAETKALLRRVGVESKQLPREGAARKGGGMQAFFLAIGFTMMLLLPLIFHGQAIMRGVVEEKTDRIVESLLSSMSAFDLLTGKVLALAGVGLTQIAIWSAMGALVGFFAAAPLIGMGVDVLSMMSVGKLAYFVIFFLLGYLIYACIFAAGGAAVNSDKEAQQLMQPILLTMMVPWMLVGLIVGDPDSTLATVLSLIPIYTPITMFIRVLVSEPPLWQILLSILLSLGTIVLLFWIASRIFRVGILWYGKRPSLPEFLRWVREA